MEARAPGFDVGFSISSFEHDGLGMYGDPLDPDGDLKAMRKMTERIKPGGLLFVAVPTGRDKLLFNNASIYGRVCLFSWRAGNGSTASGSATATSTATAAPSHFMC
jgi:hypothetical protein